MTYATPQSIDGDKAAAHLETPFVWQRDDGSFGEEATDADLPDDECDVAAWAMPVGLSGDVKEENIVTPHKGIGEQIETPETSSNQQPRTTGNKLQVPSNALG